MRRMPGYFHNFHCTGTDCRDNCCCVGWEIELDPATAEKYRRMEGELGERLRAAMYEEDGCICMGQTDGRCPFLDARNLCSIQQSLGADMLGEICREHPRYYAWFDGITEAGVGMCCEEAARLILSDPALDTFVTEDSREDNDCDYDPVVFDALFAARQTAFRLLQNRELPLGERLTLFLVFADGRNTWIWMSRSGCSRISGSFPTKPIAGVCWTLCTPGAGETKTALPTGVRCWSWLPGWIFLMLHGKTGWRRFPGIRTGSCAGAMPLLPMQLPWLMLLSMGQCIIHTVIFSGRCLTGICWQRHS